MIFKEGFFFLIFSSLIFLLSSCWPGKTREPVKMITGLAVINVLDKELHDDCHIKGSINVPFGEIKDLEKMVDKNATVVTYCTNYMCGASGAARKQLIKMGYKNVYVYEGGTAEWKKKGLPTVGPCKKGYLGNVGTPPEKKEPYMLNAEELKAKIDERFAGK